MNDLLDLAISAHGGMRRWSAITAIDAHASIGGALWSMKSRPDVLRNIRFRLETSRQLLTMDFLGQDRRTVFEPGRVTVLRGDGSLIGARDDPEASFDRDDPDAPWDDWHVAHFSGAALWTYLTVPFIYVWPGFDSQEIEPIDIGGERWRRLHVSFPATFKTHTRQQISCFGPDGLLRRQDYTVDVLGGARGVNFASNYRWSSGIALASRRRVYGWRGDYDVVPEPLLVAIDIDDVVIESRPISS